MKLPPHKNMNEDSQWRKETPVFGGFLAYFPDAVREVARYSKFGNDKHNPGQPLHWSREKSNDHVECVSRHLLDVGKPDGVSGFTHTVALAWRAMAALQCELEAARGEDPNVSK